MFFGCKNVTFKYNEKLILNNVTLQVQKGEFLGLIGNNGSGKSTLMKILCGILQPLSGDVMIEGENINQENRIKVGYVFQNPENQIVGVTVEEDVAFGMENIGIPREEMHEKIKWALSVVNLTGKEKNDPNALSGGQKQRLAMASILAMDPHIILMDEPTTMLDPLGRTEVYDVINTLLEIGKTIIIASHHSDDLKNVKRIIGMKNGKITFDGSRTDFYNRTDFIVEPPFDMKVKKAFKKSVEEVEKDICR